MLLRFTGPPVPITARVLSTPQGVGLDTHHLNHLRIFRRGEPARRRPLGQLVQLASVGVVQVGGTGRAVGKEGRGRRLPHAAEREPA
eukprot:1183210-Prorocentrum_minimum.AAC.2